MRPSLGIIWDFRFQRSAGLKLAAELGKIAQRQKWADFHKRANILAIFHLNLKKQILTISKQHILLDLENKISTNEHNFET